MLVWLGYKEEEKKREKKDKGPMKRPSYAVAQIIVLVKEKRSKGVVPVLPIVYREDQEDHKKG